MTTQICCACSAECAIVLPVGDVLGCRAGDVVCSPECEDAIVSDGHNDARYDGETCKCNTCWRVQIREAHAAISKHRRAEYLDIAVRLSITERDIKW